MTSVSFCHHLMSVVSLFVNWLQTSSWEIQNRKPNWQWCSIWIPVQVLFLWCWFVINIAATGLVKYLIDQSFKNVFSRTEEDIGMKLDIYVPINVVSKCWDLSADRKFKMATIGGERLYMIFMGNAFSPSSFWEPLYIIHPNLAEVIMNNWCTFNDKLFRDIAAMAV